MSRLLVTAGWGDVPHLDEETKERLLAAYPVHERKARTEGIPMLGSGQVFPVDPASMICAPFQIPPFFKRINGIDFGWDHPSAGTGCAWDADNDIFYVANEYRGREQTPPIIAAAIKTWGGWIPVSWPHDGLQHDKGSGDQLADMYRKAGLNMLHNRATFADGSNNVEPGIIDMLTRMQTGRFKVFSTCSMWLGEMATYHRKDGLIVKKVDDLISASRYALMMKRFAKVKTETIDLPTMSYY